MNDNFRYIIAGLLIFLIILLQPVYLKWLGYDAQPASKFDETNNTIKPPTLDTPSLPSAPIINSELINVESLVVISSPLYIATVSNKSGGSISEYSLIKKINDKHKYAGGYNSDGAYDDDAPVSLILSNENYCNPCLGTYDNILEEYVYINNPFSLKTYIGRTDTVFIGPGEKETLEFFLYDDSGVEIISKKITFYGDHFISDHHFAINGEYFVGDNNLELIWNGGLRPTEQSEAEDVQYGSAIISQAGEIDDIQITNPEKPVDRAAYNGQTDWVSVRTKYFLTALIANDPGGFATLSAKSHSFGFRENTPLYSASIGYPSTTTFISSRLYIGPLDVDSIGETHTNLDVVMNFGWAPIRPISKGILWVLKFMHNALHLNYGFVLLLFALLIRLLTGPLTKTSY